MGLGLALSKALINLMGGCLEVASVPEQGSRFCFDLDLPEVATADSSEDSGVGATLQDRAVRQLSLPGVETLALLLDLAMQGDIKALLEQADRLEQEKPSCGAFAAELRSLAKGFQVNKICCFLNTAKNQT